MEESKDETANRAHALFDRFVQAATCKGTLKAFQELCEHLEVKPQDYRSFYHRLKSKLHYWKAKALWAKLDKRGSHKDYRKGRACSNTKVRWASSGRTHRGCRARMGQVEPRSGTGGQASTCGKRPLDCSGGWTLFVRRVFTY